MKAYNNLYSYKPNSLKYTEKYSKGIFSLPLYPKLKFRDVLKISKVLQKILK
jgi:dTDP-4-amino-4,6-dideoxygalactose transaminase